MKLNKMAANLAAKRSQDFGEEVKKYRKPKPSVSSCVDGANGSADKCNVLWKNKKTCITVSVSN